MFRVAIERYVGQIRAALATGVEGADGIQSILDTVVRITVADPHRRGCLVLNAIPESATLSKETKRKRRPA